MKIRVRFLKQGVMKFVGHLDMVRYFQKVMRRAEIDVVYSEGFSPHQKMSFAAPLGVGEISQGEYFDLEVYSTGPSAEMIERVNRENVEGIKVLSWKLLPEGAKNGMSIVSAADYFVHTDRFHESDLKAFMLQDEINVLKKTKKSEKETDIRPMIYEMRWEKKGIFMKIAQGSAANLKPELVMKALAEYTHQSLPEYILYERMDMYCTQGACLVSLDEIGGNIE